MSCTRSSTSASPCRLVEHAGRRSAAAERIVLPGVGAARATLASLAEQDLVDALADAGRGDGVPFLGICIGLQVLFDHSEEGDTDVPRLGAGHGAALPRRPAGCRRSGGTRCGSPATHPVTAALPARGHYYFVNSYYCVPADDRDDVLGITDYTVEFCSVVARDNVVATQFHAEKSGALGLALPARLRGVGRPPC